MPTTILNQNEFISNYILELNLPYSSAIKNHMANLASGIIVTEGNKTISSVYNKLTSNRHRSTGSRFLNHIHGTMNMLRKNVFFMQYLKSLILVKIMKLDS